MEILSFLAAPFIASLILSGIHAYLGVHVVERGVIFVDLSLAQIAALGASVAIIYGADPHTATAYWVSLGFTFSARSYSPTCARNIRESRRKRSSESATRWRRPRPSSP